MLKYDGGEIDFLKYVKKKLKKPTLLDTSAGGGWFLKMFLDTFKDGQAHCFERVPEIYNKLNTFYLNNKSVQCYNVGLCDGDMDQHSYFYLRSLLGSKVKNGETILDYQIEQFPRNIYGNVIVKLRKLDNFLENFSSVDIMKVDANNYGSELVLLKGAKKFLEQFHPKYIFFLSGQDYADSNMFEKDTMLLLENAGYRMVNKNFNTIDSKSYVAKLDYQLFMAVKIE